jgi:hypothetical protein
MEQPSSTTFPLFKQHFLHPDVWAAQQQHRASSEGGSNGGGAPPPASSIAGRLVVGADTTTTTTTPAVVPSLKKSVSTFSNSSTSTSTGGRAAPPPALDLSGLPSRGALSRQESGAAAAAAAAPPPLLASAGGSATFSAASLRSSIASLGGFGGFGFGPGCADEDATNADGPTDAADAAAADAPALAALAALDAGPNGLNPTDTDNSAYLLSESALKRRKFALFERDCSRVAEGLFVAGESVARSRALLAEKKITHVLNCVGQLYAPFFADLGVSYHTLHLRDAPNEDLLCVLHDALDFIDGARRAAAPATALLEAGVAVADGAEEGNGAGSGGGAGAGKASAGSEGRGGRAPGAEEGQGQKKNGTGGTGASAAATTAAPKSAAKPPPIPQNPTTATPTPSASTAGVSGGGQVLVHCSQGVSRSAALAVAYLMWSCDWPYARAYAHVRQLRGVAAPNIGFTCQLLQWGQRRRHAQEAAEAKAGKAVAGESQPPPALQPVRLYRVAPHCAEAPLYLVAKAVAGLGSGGNGNGGNGLAAAASPPPASAAAALGGGATPTTAQQQLWRALDSRGAFVVVAPLQHPAALVAAAAADAPAPAPGCWVWRGASCPRALAAAAARAAAQLSRYEGAPSPCVPVAQGREPPALLAALGFAAGGGEEAILTLGRRLSRQASLSSPAPAPAVAPATAAAVAAASPAASSGLASVVGEVDAYTADYQLYALAAAARGEGEE